MKTSKKQKKTTEISEQVVADHTCDFCRKTFVRNTTFLTHMCEGKRRWQDKDRLSSRLGFQTWVRFYSKNTFGTKNRTFQEFLKSSYYSAFVKFGNYCAEVNVINVSRYADWLLENKIRIDEWTRDSHYTKFIIDFCKTEDPIDAIARSIETTISLAEIDQIQSKDCLRYGNRNKICYAITAGRISPWMLYQSDSGIEFLSSLDEGLQKSIMDYIKPEQWAIRFIRNKEIIPQVKELLKAAGY